MDPVSKKVFACIADTVTQLGYEIVDVEYQKRMQDMHLTVFIDCSKGITLDDCETVHVAIDPLIEALNPTNDMPYFLNVSSPGLDRPFKSKRDYERNYGKDVEIKLYGPIKGQKVFEGNLKEKEAHAVVIVCGGQEIKIEDSRIAYVRPLVKFE